MIRLFKKKKLIAYNKKIQCIIGKAVETPNERNKKPLNLLQSGVLNFDIRLMKKTMIANVHMKVKYKVKNTKDE